RVRRRDLEETRVQLALREIARQLGDQHVGAQHEAGAEHEDRCNENEGRHQRTSVTPSNMSGGRWMPDALRRSQAFGRTPVARNRPITLPSGVTPSFSKQKI